MGWVKHPSPLRLQHRHPPLCPCAPPPQEHTNQGLRVIGLAVRELPAELSEAQVLGCSQEELEQGAQFCGHVLMLNR